MPEIIQNPINENEPVIPGRLIVTKQPYLAPVSRKFLQLISTSMTFEENQIIKTEEIGRTVEPPLDDGTVPSDVSEIRECSRCLSLVSFCNCFTCTCGLTFCLACGVTINMDYFPIRLCINCAEKLQNTLLQKCWAWLWSAK